MRHHVEERPMRYKTFISYSHAADGRLAASFQKALQPFAKRWHQIRAFRIFRDITRLSATPALWSMIQNALDQAEYFILLASPAAAQSHWLDRELEYWLTHRSAETMARRDGMAFQGLAGFVRPCQRRQVGIRMRHPSNGPRQRYTSSK
jgi:hypothetical protein